MEGKKKRGLVATFPWRTLKAPLREDERRALSLQLGQLLAWQERLGVFPRLTWAPDATPFVSLYARGRLRGCFGSDEGSPTERLVRAFLRALEDSRFGGVSAADRPHLVAQLAYVRQARAYDPSRIAELFEPGADGVACVREGSPPVNFLPEVARDNGMGTTRFLNGLGHKAGLGGAHFNGAHLFLFQTDEIVARRGRTTTRSGEPNDLAARWLSQLVDPNGRISFAIDPRRRERSGVGPMWHGRAAVALQAMVAHGHHARHARLARVWLKNDIERALRGVRVEGWPDEPAVVAGTLALASKAGLDVTGPLGEYAKKREVFAHPWHAAQVAYALGRDAPADLWIACVADLERRPWAPWTALAARARRDAKVIATCERSLAPTLRSRAPHIGGTSTTDVPEIALTAVTIEALAGLPSSTARAAVRRGRAFLRRWQYGTEIPASIDPVLAMGAFPASPVESVLRCDITAHALLALLERELM
jgi:AMMECR1 domain-containing protein